METNAKNPGPSPASDAVNNEVLAHETLVRLMPELQALTSEDIIQINVDVPSAIATVLGALPKILPYREQVAKAMPEYDIRSFDKLEDYAVALSDAHSAYLGASGPSDNFESLVEEGVHLRELLLADATSLGLRGLVNGAKLDELKGSVGHKNLASDLGMLSKLLEASWPQIQGKTAVQPEELERAARLSLHIVRAVGLRQQSGPTVAEATNIRARAFTLFVTHYDSVRRALQFLRWKEDDSDKIAPSLFAGRTIRRKGTDVPSESKDKDASTAEAAPGSSTVVPAGTATAARSARPLSAADDAGQAAPSAGSAGSKGTPGSDPFLEH